MPWRLRQSPREGSRSETRRLLGLWIGVSPKQTPLIWGHLGGWERIEAKITTKPVPWGPDRKLA